MNKKNTSDERQREAGRILDKVAAESEVVGTSSLVRTANKTREHFSGTEDEQSDSIEIWAKRIGRGLSLIVFVALAIWLYNFLTRGG